MAIETDAKIARSLVPREHLLAAVPGHGSTALGPDVRQTASDAANANLEQMRGRLPVMPDGEIATLVESWIDYSPLIDVGLDPFTFKEMAVTRPRFAGQLCFNADLAGLPINAIC